MSNLENLKACIVEKNPRNWQELSTFVNEIADFHRAELIASGACKTWGASFAPTSSQPGVEPDAQFSYARVCLYARIGLHIARRSRVHTEDPTKNYDAEPAALGALVEKLVFAGELAHVFAEAALEIAAIQRNDEAKRKEISQKLQPFKRAQIIGTPLMPIKTSFRATTEFIFPDIVMPRSVIDETYLLLYPSL